MLSLAEIRDNLRGTKTQETPAPAVPLAPVSSDSIQHMFALRNLPEHARLRQLYAATQAAADALRAFDAKIADAEQQLGSLRVRAQQLKPAPHTITAASELPTAEQAQEYAALGAHADMINLYLDAWRESRASYARRLEEARREWEAAWQYWGVLVYRATGESRCLAPGSMVMTDEQLGSWQLSHLQRTLRELEQ